MKHGKEALKSSKMSLEAEKRKVEEDLEAERALGVDKDSLKRSEKREVESEDDVAALQANLDTSDSQLGRTIATTRRRKRSTNPYVLPSMGPPSILFDLKQSKRSGRSSMKSCLKACESRKRRLKFYSLSGMSFVNCRKTPRDI